jgi:hypothetical protein
MTERKFINEIIRNNGKSWLVCWELRGRLRQTNANTLEANETFTCGKDVYKVDYHLIFSKNGWNSQLDFESTKSNNSFNDQRFIVKNFSSDDKSGSMVTVFHQGIKKEGLLEKELQLSWPLRILATKSMKAPKNIS